MSKVIVNSQYNTKQNIAYFVDDQLEHRRDVHADDVEAIEGELRGARAAIVDWRPVWLLAHQPERTFGTASAFEAQRFAHLIVELRARSRTPHRSTMRKGLSFEHSLEVPFALLYFTVQCIKCSTFDMSVCRNT